MKQTKSSFTVLFLSLAFLAGVTATAGRIPGNLAPDSFFGFTPGSDGMLFGYEALTGYFQKLDEASGRVKMSEAGYSPQGRKMYVVFISSEENIADLENLRDINKQLALNAGLTDRERNSLAEKGKVFLMATLSMHSTEVGPAQASPLIAWKLVTSEDPSVRRILQNVVFMVVPTHNPDGMDMVVSHYNHYKGTRYERSPFPGLYHKYLGHDNNRDFNNLTQEDTRTVSRLYSTEWYPQVLTDKHQMGTTGPRYFVPPYHDPVSENIDPELWNWTGLFGANLIRDMTREGLAGVSTHNGFDNYWPGSTKTSLWKNIITFLTECASAHMATPVYIEPSELAVRGKGLSEYEISTNMPMPWPGGWWRLGDIVRYEMSSAFSALSTAAVYREEILRFRNDLCRRQVELGKTQPPFSYILPLEQHDPGELASLVRVLQEHGVEIFRLKNDHVAENQVFHAGDIIIPMSQPYRQLVKELMEKQTYPERHYTPDGPMIKPYDITSWSLPMHRGLVSYEMHIRNDHLENDISPVPVPYRLTAEVPSAFRYAILPASSNGSYKVAFAALGKKMKVQRLPADWEYEGKRIPAGSFVIARSGELNSLLENSDVLPVFLSREPDVALKEVLLPRVGLIETWFHDVDAGWTRFLLDSYHIPFTVLHPGDIGNTSLSEHYDVLLLPDNAKTVLMEGKQSRGNVTVVSDYPPEYAKGLTAGGLDRLLTFLAGGGTIVSWGESAGLFAGNLAIRHENGDPEEFRLPFAQEGETLTNAGLYAPGCLARVALTPGHPLTWGMQPETGIFYRGRGAFTTSPPLMDTDRRVIALFPGKEILQSGYMENEKLLAGKSAMVWIKKGEGQLVLMAFSPAFRASTQGTYKLLFNSILLE